MEAAVSLQKQTHIIFYIDENGHLRHDRGVRLFGELGASVFVVRLTLEAERKSPSNNEYKRRFLLIFSLLMICVH